MDEIGICCSEIPERGNVFIAKRSARGRGLPQPRVAKSRNLYSTLVAFVCNNVAIQSKLPQILIANEHTFLKRDVKEIVGACGSNMIIVRCVLLAHCLFYYAPF